MSVISNNQLAGAAGQGGAAGFQIDRSLRFNPSNSPSLSKTFSTAGDRTKWSWSAWVKKCANDKSIDQCLFGGYSASNDTDWFEFGFGGSNDHSPVDKFYWTTNNNTSGTTAKFRDNSAWYHILVTYDGSNIKAYANSSLVLTSSKTGNLGINGNWHHSIGKGPNSSSARPFDGYMADVYFIDGQALAPTDFGEYDDNNVWQPKAFTSFNNPNNGTTWSNAVPTSDGFRPGRAAADGFDNDLTTYVAINNTTFNLDVGSWNLSGTMEVYTGANMQYAVDGGSASSMTADGWTTVGDAGSITTLTLTRTDSNYPYFYAVRVGGYVLIDGANDNSFHLKFSDNSSDAALGTDTSGNSNTWTNNNLAATTVNTMPVYGAWTGYAGGQWSSSDTWNSLSDASSSFGNNGGTKGYSSTTETWTGTKTSWTGAFGASNRGANGWALKFPISVTITVNPVATSSIVACASTSTAISAGTSYTSFPATMTGQVFWFQCSGYPSVGVYNSVAAPDSSITDSVIDTPSNYTSDSGNNGGNYATLNYLSKDVVGSATLTDGNLKLSATTFGHYIDSRSTIAASSFDCYCEMDVTDKGGAGLVGFGIGDITSRISSGTGSYIAIRENGQIRSYPGNTLEGTVNSFTTGDVIGMAVSSSQVKFYKNGSLEGTFSHSLTGDFFVTAMAYDNGNDSVIDLNFGQRDFQISSVPTGYKSLCSTNFPDPTVAEGSTAMDVALYTGNGNSGQTVSGLNFSPDLVWFKARSETRNHAVFDAVRGVEKRIQPNKTQIEDDSPSGLTAFNSDGFTFGGNNSNGRNGVTYAAWAWDAGSSTVSKSVGDDNSSAYDTSQTWSNSLSSPQGSYGSSSTTNAFNGNLSNGFESGTPSGGYSTMRFEPSSGITVSSVRIYASDYNDSQVTFQWRVNDGSWNDISYSSGNTYKRWIDFNFSGTLNSFEYRSNTSITYKPELRAVELSGKMLIDNGTSLSGLTQYPSIATSVRANPSTGFSIASWTGTGSAGTISHGLNAAPEFIIVKNRDTDRPWSVFHQAITNMSSGYFNLNLTNTFTGSYTGVWNGSDPTTGVFSVGTDNEVNNNGDDFIGYCWTPVLGYSSFGEYTGGSNKFVYTGFKPQWLLLKSYAGDGFNWVVIDDERGYDSSNVSNKLYPNKDSGEDDDSRSSETKVVFLSNGFTFLDQGAETNSGSRSYVYAAFASHPFKYSRAGS